MDLEFIKTINLRVVFPLGGVVILTEQEPTNDESGFVCLNASCRKTFTHPLKAVNVAISPKPYDACPYCLSEISRKAVAPVVTVQSKEDQPELKKQSTQKEADHAANTSPECKNFLGFLGQRPPKSPIPDECLTCQVIVQCMLRKEP